MDHDTIYKRAWQGLISTIKKRMEGVITAERSSAFFYFELFFGFHLSYASRISHWFKGVWRRVPNDVARPCFFCSFHGVYSWKKNRFCLLDYDVARPCFFVPFMTSIFGKKTGSVCSTTTSSASTWPRRSRSLLWPPFSFFISLFVLLRSMNGPLVALERRLHCSLLGLCSYGPI